jgi:hypothetical protein
MRLLKSPVLAGALAAVLMSTTGYCVLSRGETPAPAPVSLLPAPMIGAPELIEPFPLDPLPGLEVRSDLLTN